MSETKLQTIDSRHWMSMTNPEREALIQGLAQVLADCVEGGASVSFMLPMTQQKAITFWRQATSCVAQGERVLVVAFDRLGVCGTAQVILAQPENQPHRADLAKMLVHRRAREAGVGAAVLHAAETAAHSAGKTLLVLDTASDAAERLYLRAGWKEAGRVPGYALLPAGGECDTVFYWKRLNKNRQDQAGSTT